MYHSLLIRWNWKPSSASPKFCLVRFHNREWSDVSFIHSMGEMRWKGCCTEQLVSAQLLSLRPCWSLKAVTVRRKNTTKQPEWSKQYQAEEPQQKDTEKALIYRLEGNVLQSLLVSANVFKVGNYHLFILFDITFFFSKVQSAFSQFSFS